MSKHNLQEFAFAKDVVKDFPVILAKLNQLEKELQEYDKFLCVGHVLDAVHDSKQMINRQYAHYRKVLAKKGEE